MICRVLNPSLIEELRARLSTLPREDHRPIGAPAAVLIPFVYKPEGWALLLTKRSTALRRHSGEISFPGGLVDENEDSRSAALREAREELGIDPDSVELLGKLQSVHTIVSAMLIDPWIGIVEEQVLSPNPSEIEEVLEVPMQVLLDPKTYREQRFIRAGHLFPSPAFDVGDQTIWGATARILRNLLDLLAGSKSQDA